MIAGWLRKRRLQVRQDELAAARARRVTVEEVMAHGPGIMVWADPRAVEAARVPRLVEHIVAIHRKSGRLLADAERNGYDVAFTESLRRLHHHHAGLLEEIAPRRVR
jgi:hypothetical protein